MTAASDIPPYSVKRFAQDATGPYLRSVPQTTSDPNAASFSQGFPPNTFVDTGAGGSPPDGRDVNGILQFLSAWAQWVGLGGPIPYNPTVSGNGGYPKGARVQSATNPPRVWLCTTDGNTTNPDTGGAGWVSDVSVSYQDFTAAGSGSVTVPAWATHAEVAVVGAGGGGSGSPSGYSGGGGGAGGYAWGVISVTPGASLAYTVGGGGAGGSGGNGSTGGNSQLAGLTSTGGLGGNGSSGAGGGSASGAPRNFSGGVGDDGNSSNSAIQGGGGAPGPYGGGGRSGRPLGVPGQAPGAGGGGAWGGSSATGGNGADGAVLIRWLP